MSPRRHAGSLYGRRSWRPVPDTARERQRWRRLLWSLQGGRCRRCGHRVRVRDATLDHITPRAAGGEDTPENYQVLCGACNATKADDLPERRGRAREEDDR